MLDLSPKGLKDLLEAIDEEAELELGKSNRYVMVIVGSAALLLSRLTSRNVTFDVDVLRTDVALEGIVARHPQLNSQVRVYADRLPAGFEKRLVRLPIESSVIDFYRPSNEDMAVMKLYSWRKQDQIDLLSSEMLDALDLKLLDSLVYDDGEAKSSSITSLAYRAMVETYEKRYRPKLLRRNKQARGRSR